MIGDPQKGSKKPDLSVGKDSHRQSGARGWVLGDLVAQVMHHRAIRSLCLFVFIRCGARGTLGTLSRPQARHHVAECNNNLARARPVRGPPGEWTIARRANMRSSRLQRPALAKRLPHTQLSRTSAAAMVEPQLITFQSPLTQSVWRHRVQGPLRRCRTHRLQ
jgi:hypothetical protein